MFKKTPAPQLDMFREITTELSARKASILNASASWHNVFYREVTQRIDESVFEPLFHQGGRPNAPLRVLVGMMVLKEGNGWSDQQLFNDCRFNLCCMRALGLFHIDEDIPVESTYYEFRRRLGKHHQKYGHDLIAESFHHVTHNQIKAHNIKGEKIRMDSKLIQSNIAKSSRLELLLETVRVSVAALNLKPLSVVLNQQDLSLLESLQVKTVSNITYQEQDVDKADNDTPGLGRKIVLKDRKAIPSDSLQSAHDPQAAYPCKGQGHTKQMVSGYHSNITETCSEENPFNLITDVQVAAANSSENEFLIEAIEATKQVLDTGDSVKHVTTDGGYDSRDNREFMCKEDKPHWNMAKNKGTQLRYQISHDREGKLRVYCKNSKAYCKVTFSQRVAKAVIHHSDGSKRYMTQSDIKYYLLLQQHFEAQDPQDINIRPNVEATIHQVFHRLLKRDKVKYRGIYKCSLYVFSRALWTNFRRILKNELEEAALWLFFLFCPCKGLPWGQKRTFYCSLVK